MYNNYLDKRKNRDITIETCTFKKEEKLRNSKFNVH